MVESGEAPQEGVRSSVATAAIARHGREGGGPGPQEGPWDSRNRREQCLQ